MANDTPSYELVYAIQSKNLKYVKIGFTTDVNQRLSSLQGGSPDELQVIGCWLGSVDDERRLHEELRRWRIHREWFEPASEVIQVVTERNQAIKGSKDGQILLPLPCGTNLEIWETCRDNRRDKYSPRPSLTALVDLISKASELSQSLPPHHGVIADQIVSDAKAAYDAAISSAHSPVVKAQQRARQTREYCSFCGKLAQDVEKLIDGQGLYICNECVSICVAILNAATPEERHCYHIQCGKDFEMGRDYVYSAKSKGDALRLWANNYSPIGDGVSVLTIKPIKDDDNLTYHYDDGEGKQPETKTYLQWAQEKVGFVAEYLKARPLHIPQLEALKKENQDLLKEAENERAKCRQIREELTAPRKLTWKERLLGVTQKRA